MNSVKIIDPASLKMWLPFENDFTDKSGNGVSCTNVGGLGYADSPIGRGIQFVGGTTKYIDVPVAVFNALTGAMALRTRFINEYNPAYATNIQMSWYRDNNNRGYIWCGTSDGGNNWLVGIANNVSGSWVFAITTTAKYKTGQLLDIVYTVDTSNNYILAINGAVELSGTNANAHPKVTGTATKFQNGATWYAGAINGEAAKGIFTDTFIHSKAFTDKEISYFHYAKKHFYGG